MGCLSSTFANDNNKMNNTPKGYSEGASNKNRSFKRRYFTHVSSGSSSGFSSAGNTPSECSILSRFNSTSSSFQSNKTKAKKASPFTLAQKNIPGAMEMLSICDDFGEAEKMKQQQTNRSFGYYSDSISTGSSISTPSQSCLTCTQDAIIRSDSATVAATPTPTDLEMEMYMISQSQSLMPKTSSPIYQRKNVTFHAMAVPSPTVHSYRKWATYLQSTPTYMIHNITDIPEAIAGQFSPSDFPAFTDFQEIENAAKRLKMDIHPVSESEEDQVLYHQEINEPYLSTEL